MAGDFMKLNLYTSVYRNDWGYCDGLALIAASSLHEAKQFVVHNENWCDPEIVKDALYDGQPGIIQSAWHEG